MELVKDVETDHKDYVFIRSIIKKGYNNYSTIISRCKDPNVKIEDSSKKLENLVKWGQVEAKSYIASSGEVKKKYILAPQRLPSVYSAAGIDQLGGWQADSVIKGRLDFDSLLNIISKFYDEPKKDILSPCRRSELVICRQMFCYIMYENTNSSLKSIGEFLGGRDHSTVIHAKETAKNLMDVEKKFNAQYERLIEFINSRL